MILSFISFYVIICTIPLYGFRIIGWRLYGDRTFFMNYAKYKQQQNLQTCLILFSMCDKEPSFKLFKKKSTQERRRECIVQTNPSSFFLLIENLKDAASNQLKYNRPLKLELKETEVKFQIVCCALIQQNIRGGKMQRQKEKPTAHIFYIPEFQSSE